MTRVFCSIPTARPGLINGQAFTLDEACGALVSVGEVSPQNIALFSSVPGYSVEDDEAAAAAARLAAEQAQARATAAAEKAAKSVAGRAPAKS